MTPPIPSPNPDGEITMPEMARLAGVTRPAVSNWRKRFKDFPAPIRTDSSGADVFRLGDVEQWLDKHKKRRRQFTGGEVMWHALDSLRGEAPTERVIELACIALALRRVALDKPELEDAALEARAGHGQQVTSDRRRRLFVSPRGSPRTDQSSLTPSRTAPQSIPAHDRASSRSSLPAEFADRDHRGVRVPPRTTASVAR